MVTLQVKEIALLLEEQLGLVKGWLLATPCKVGTRICTTFQAFSKAGAWTGGYAAGCLGKGKQG